MKIQPKLSFHLSSFDLHVLSTPPAFILSQDQTLKLKFLSFAKKFYEQISIGNVRISSLFRKSCRISSDVYPLLFFIVLFLNLELTLGSLISTVQFSKTNVLAFSSRCQQKLFYHFHFRLSRTFFRLFTFCFHAFFLTASI